MPGLDSQPKGLDSRKTHEGLHKMSLHSKSSYKNVVILGWKIVAVLFFFIHIAASFVVFNILFSALVPRATCCPKFRQFTSLRWIICHAFFASLWWLVKSSGRRRGAAPFRAASRSPRLHKSLVSCQENSCPSLLWHEWILQFRNVISWRQGMDCKARRRSRQHVTMNGDASYLHSMAITRSYGHAMPGGKNVDFLKRQQR